MVRTNSALTKDHGSVPHKTYTPNGKQECARRMQQISTNRLKPENGLVVVVAKPKKSRKKKEPTT